MSRRVALGIGTVALLALLLAGVFRLFELRYVRGDVYPPYSTLRADPLGAKVLFDAFGAMTGFEPQRNFRPLIRLKPGKPVALVYIGVDFRARWSDDELREFESLVTAGTRAVFSFRREFKSTGTQRLTTAKTKAGTPAPGGNPPPKKIAADEEPPGVVFGDVANRWGFSFDIAQDEERDALRGTALRADDAGELDPSVPWHSALYFKGLSPQWRVLYRTNGVPVIAERDFGTGSIVIASDSYFLSNEALRGARAPKLIARVIGPPRTVVFDEEHHGVTEEMNVVGLARKHGLEGAMLAILFVVALFVWKNAVPFLPARADSRIDDADVTGANAAEGFVNLLRRSLSPGRLLATCAAEWRRARGRRLRPEEASHVETVMRAHEARGLSGRDAAAAYRTIAEGLRRR
ncbi:MAG: DUF4350 domain-containing protein [Chthoniobacteraceae bacterium]